MVVAGFIVVTCCFACVLDVVCWLIVVWWLFWLGLLFCSEWFVWFVLGRAGVDGYFACFNWFGFGGCLLCACVLRCFDGLVFAGGYGGLGLGLVIVVLYGLWLL